MNRRLQFGCCFTWSRIGARVLLLCCREHHICPHATRLLRFKFVRITTHQVIPLPHSHPCTIIRHNSSVKSAQHYHCKPECNKIASSYAEYPNCVRWKQNAQSNEVVTPNSQNSSNIWVKLSQESIALAAIARAQSLQSQHWNRSVNDKNSRFSLKFRSLTFCSAPRWAHTLSSCLPWRNESHRCPNWMTSYSQ